MRKRLGLISIVRIKVIVEKNYISCFQYCTNLFQRPLNSRNILKNILICRNVNQSFGIIISQKFFGEYSILMTKRFSELSYSSLDDFNFYSLILRRHICSFSSFSSFLLFRIISHIIEQLLYILIKPHISIFNFS